MSKIAMDIEQHLTGIKEQIRQKIDSMYMVKTPLNVELKEDYSIVTELDIFISDLFKNLIDKYFPGVSFYCEEQQIGTDFPICILDPIDGTKELVSKNGECSVSFGIYNSADFDDEENFSWIYNPFTGFEIKSNQICSQHYTRDFSKKPLCLISRSEDKAGIFNDMSGYTTHAVGSIAYKLGLLAAGSSDCVISLRPKNIWDIAAGTHICRKLGLHFYSEGVEVKSISLNKHMPPLVWGPLEICNKFLESEK